MTDEHNTYLRFEVSVRISKWTLLNGKMCKLNTTTLNLKP